MSLSKRNLSRIEMDILEMVNFTPDITESAILEYAMSKHDNVDLEYVRGLFWNLCLFYLDRDGEKVNITSFGKSAIYFRDSIFFTCLNYPNEDWCDCLTCFVDENQDLASDEMLSEVESFVNMANWDDQLEFIKNKYPRNYEWILEQEA